VQAWLVALLTATLGLGQQAAPSRPLLEVSSRVSADRVAVGERFTITLDLTPAPKIHVYAPGVVGYKPIAFTVQPQRGLVIRGATYPASETYFYAPLKETVAVYQNPFRVVQELALDPSPSGRAALKEAATIVVRGTLTYQACNDRVCFPPRTVPMTWTVAIKERDVRDALPSSSAGRWEAVLPYSANGTPSTYSVNGRQYVVVPAGGGKRRPGGAPLESGGLYVAFEPAR
jgi:hypothetical protein